MGKGVSFPYGIPQVMPNLQFTPTTSLLVFIQISSPPSHKGGHPFNQVKSRLRVMASQWTMSGLILELTGPPLSYQSLLLVTFNRIESNDFFWKYITPVLVHGPLF